MTIPILIVLIIITSFLSFYDINANTLECIFARNRNSIYRLSVTLSWVSLIVVLVSLITVCCKELSVIFIIGPLALVYSIVILWLSTKIRLFNKCCGSFIFYFSYVPLLLVGAMGCTSEAIISVIIQTLYFKNNVFGYPSFIILHKKFLSAFVEASKNKSDFNLYNNELVEIMPQNLPDFSYAGNYKFDNSLLPVYYAGDYDILPNQKEDSLPKLQKLINRVGQSGGGVIIIPKGVYYLNYKTQKPSMLQINYSNVELCGEVDDKGRNTTTLISCCSTLNNSRSPWLSPFIITTGELLQKSNYFWGVDFKKKNNKIVTQGDSLIDPGNDGNILQPSYCCRIIQDAPKGNSVLYVDQAENISKFILITEYNTSIDGNLIKEILGRDSLNKEWITANRAGSEYAPSYQWLIEVDRVENNKLFLKQPLRRDIKLEFSPSIYNVDMLENIAIRNINIKSKWSGVFRHHGFPFYYTIRESQDMDYGWNGINLKRAYNSLLSNISLENFTNPLYVLDSKNCTIKDLVIKGYDGHQGLKVYGHSCDNILENIDIYNHFADFIGGEGNIYGNVFSRIRYLNPLNKYVDYDFHGFSEGPFSPPAENLFELCENIRGIKAAGTMYNQPACALDNIWWNIKSDGYDGSNYLFFHEIYVRKKGFRLILCAIRHAFVKMLQKKSYSASFFLLSYKEKIENMAELSYERSQHVNLFKGCRIYGIISKNRIQYMECDQNYTNDYVHIESKFYKNKSLYNYQKYEEKNRSFITK